MIIVVVINAPQTSFLIWERVNSLFWPARRRGIIIFIPPLQSLRGLAALGAQRARKFLIGNESNEIILLFSLAKLREILYQVNGTPRTMMDDLSLVSKSLPLALRSSSASLVFIKVEHWAKLLLFMVDHQSEHAVADCCQIVVWLDD